MGRLIFAIAWTALTASFALFNTTPDLDGGDRAVFIALPIFGAIFTVFIWLDWRRRRSLRTEIVGGVTVYVWTDLAGRECRSERDPTPDWGDGDGDGDGGD